MKFSFIISLSYLLLSCTSLQITNNALQTTDFYLEIKQTVSGANKQHTFIFTKNRLYIFENSISKEGLAERKKICSKKIKDITTIKNIEKKTEELKGLKTEYVNAQIGGLRWEIEFIKDNNNKKIVIENTSIIEINQLFESINSIIPERKPQLYKN